MILRQNFVRNCVRRCASIKTSCNHVRGASVSSQIFRSRPEHPTRTDYLQKYQEKLERKAREEGVSSISELRERYQPKIEVLKKKLAALPPSPPRKTRTVSTTSPQSSTPPAVTPIKTLSSYVDVEKLRKHTDPREIELIWRAGHTKDSLICAVIPIGIYTRMISLAREHPMFILPLPRESGVEMHFMQFKFPEANVSHILFTSLLEYKTHGEFARPHTTVMHFEDLAEEKGIVLMRGEVDSGHGMGLEDARMLVIGVQKLFGTDVSSERGKIRRELIEKFSKGSEEFDVTTLMDELNHIE